MQDVKEFGAKGNGRADDTAAIRTALASLGIGETLEFSKGTYKVTEEIRPPSHCILDFKDGAKLVQAGTAHLMFFENVEDITTINMRLRHNSKQTTANPLRISNSHHMLLKDTVIERTDAWSCYVLGGSHHIVFDGYVNLTAENKNTNIDDGIDFAECHDIELMNFDIRTNDDGISFKSWLTGTHSIYVHDGVIRSRDCGISFGTEISAPMYGISIENVQFLNTGIPIFIKLYEEQYQAMITNVIIKNIVCEDKIGNGQRAIFSRKYDTTPRLLNFVIEDFDWVGPLEWDFIHVMRTEGLTIRNATCWATTVRLPKRKPTRNRWGIWLDNSPNSVFENIALEGMGAAVRLEGSETVGNYFAIVPPIGQIIEYNGGIIANQVWE